MKFNEFKLNKTIIKALDKTGFSEATEIQEKAIPLFLDDKNIFGKSSTGTGKTAAFALPLLNKIDINNKKPQAIIMAPTRELAYQIVQELRKFSDGMFGLSVATVIGGAPMREQTRKMRTSQIIVGTPGRVNDHLQRKTLETSWISTIILDEADEMLKMGFKKEIDNIFEAIDPNAQKGLFSATSSPKVMNIVNNYMGEYELIEIKNEIKVNSNIESIFVFTKGVSKEELILEVFKKHKPQKAIIFSNTKSNTDKIAKNLRTIGVKAVVINGDKSQNQRTRSIKQFRNNEFDVLVATDVVARGIDIKDIDYVINYDISMEDEQFVHRIGRTGRNNSKGKSISFIQNKSTLSQLNQIKKRYKIEVDEVESTEYNLTPEISTERTREKRDRNNSYSRNKNFGPSRGGSGRGGNRSRGGNRDRGQRTEFDFESKGQRRNNNGRRSSGNSRKKMD